MDIFDQATEHEQRFRDQALRAAAAQMPRGASATHCRAPDCGIEIPAQRRRALPGVELCIDCQTIKERTGR